jgi:hypothetical protein
MPGHCQWAASKDGCLDVALVHSTWHFSPGTIEWTLKKFKNILHM